MENATKALLMAGGVLIAIIIISVLVITLQRTGNVSQTYDRTIDQEEIAKFNSNFTKYLGQDLTIHQVVTICNFARQNNVRITSGAKTESDISKDLEDISTTSDGKRIQNTYRISISNGSDGYVSSISFSGPTKKTI